MGLGIPWATSLASQESQNLVKRKLINETRKYVAGNKIEGSEIKTLINVEYNKKIRKEKIESILINSK